MNVVTIIGEGFSCAGGGNIAGGNCVLERNP